MKTKILLFIVFIFFLSQRSNGQNLQAGLIAFFPFYGTGWLADSAKVGLIQTSGVSVFHDIDECAMAGSAARFGGPGAYISVNPNGLFDFGTTGNFSIAFLFKTATSANQSVFSNYGKTQGWTAGLLNVNVGKVTMAIGGTLPISVSSSNTFNDNTWHQGVITVDRSTQRIKIFVDTVQQNLINNSANGTVINSNEFDISATGSNANPGKDTVLLAFVSRMGRDFNGFLDEVRFYNRTLTQADVNALNGLRICTVGIDELAANDKLFSVNPTLITTSDPINISLGKYLNNAPLAIYNSLGQKVYFDYVTGTTKTLNLNLALGIYFVQITNGNDRWTERIIKQ